LGLQLGEQSASLQMVPVLFPDVTAYRCMMLEQCVSPGCAMKAIAATKLRETLRWIARYWRHGIVVGDSHARF